MSEDLIKREDVIEAIHDYWKGELGKMPVADSEDGEVLVGDYAELLKHNKELSTRIKAIPSADRPPKVIAQVTFDEEKLREIVKEAVERFKEEYEITDRPQGKWIEDARTYYETLNAKGYFVDQHTPSFTDDIACPNCLAKFSTIDNETERFDYCPHCGCRMERSRR